jgi:hypothetical protein
MNRLTHEILVQARKWIGHTETAPNYSPQICIWLRNAHVLFPAPWCAAFAWGMLDDACRELGLRNPVRPTASAHKLLTEGDRLGARSTEPGPGYLFGVDHGGGKGHCGIVVEVDGDAVCSIEGNTNAAGSREGNCVATHRRKIADCSLGFLDPGSLFDGHRTW